MPAQRYIPSRTAVVLVDPYNDFLSEGGKVYPLIEPIANELLDAIEGQETLIGIVEQLTQLLGGRKRGHRPPQRQHRQAVLRHGQWQVPGGVPAPPVRSRQPDGKVHVIPGIGGWIEQVQPIPGRAE